MTRDEIFESFTCVRTSPEISTKKVGKGENDELAGTNGHTIPEDRASTYHHIQLWEQPHPSNMWDRIF